MSKQNLNVLLIEDDPEDVDLTQEALEETGLEISLEIFSSGEDAIAHLCPPESPNRVNLPDLIWLDLNLPGMNGQEILQFIRAEDSLKHIPIVILTTSDTPEDILTSYRTGANCYIKKPVGIREFRRMLEVLEDFWFTVAKLPAAHN